MFSLISLPVPSQQMTMFLMDADSPQVAGGRLATGGGIGHCIGVNGSPFLQAPCHGASGIIMIRLGGKQNQPVIARLLYI
jgi:hypothetical protein